MKSILISGSATGLGLALATYALEKGYKVFGVYNNTPPSHQLITTYPKLFIPLQLNIGNEKMVSDAIAKIKEHLGNESLFALINNAAYAQAKPILLSDPEDFLLHFRTNVLGNFFMIKHCIPLLAPAPHYGRIVNINSVAAQLPLPFQGAYGISKISLTHLSNMLRIEQVRDQAFPIIDIWLGMVQTDIHRRNIREGMDLRNTPYEEWKNQVIKRLNQNYSKALTPESVSQKIFDILHKPKPKYVYLISRNKAMIRILFLLKNRPILGKIIRYAYFRER